MNNVLYLAYVGFNKEGGCIYHLVLDDYMIDVTSGGNIKKIKKGDEILQESDFEEGFIRFIKSRAVAFSLDMQKMASMFKIDFTQINQEKI